jgi:peptidoglycan/LPS O-acetylase OafA/YrhL
MIKPLTSLRIVFAIMVFLSHLQFFPKTDVLFTKVYKSIFYEGYLGVSFFFILSGFVLSLSYKKRFSESKISYRDYLIARIARIYPLHILTLLISVPLMLPYLKVSILGFCAKLVTNLLLLQSWIPNSEFYFSFNAPSWSISDEFFFYLIFPFLILLARPKKILPIAVLILVPIGVYLIPETIHHKFFYVNPIFRMFDFFIGILVHRVYEKNIFKPTSKVTATCQELFAIGIFIVFFFYHKHIPQGYRFSCYYWIPMTIVILTFSYAHGSLSKVLSNRWLVLGGEISFGFYMIHQLVIKYMVYLNSKLKIISNNYVLSLMVFFLAIVASYFLYKLYEIPLNRYIKEIGLKKGTKVDKLDNVSMAA